MAEALAAAPDPDLRVLSRPVAVPVSPGSLPAVPAPIAAVTRIWFPASVEDSAEAEAVAADLPPQPTAATGSEEGLSVADATDLVNRGLTKMLEEMKADHEAAPPKAAAFKDPVPTEASSSSASTKGQGKGQQTIMTALAAVKQQGAAALAAVEPPVKKAKVAEEGAEEKPAAKPAAKACGGRVRRLLSLRRRRSLQRSLRQRQRRRRQRRRAEGGVVGEAEANGGKWWRKMAQMPRRRRPLKTQRVFWTISRPGQTPERWRQMAKWQRPIT